MKPGAQGTAILTQTLNDEGALLRHNNGGLGNDDDDEKSENDNDDKSAHTCLRFSLIRRARRSSDLRRAQLCSADRGRQTAPRYCACSTTCRAILPYPRCSPKCLQGARRLRPPGC